MQHKGPELAAQPPQALAMLSSKVIRIGFVGRDDEPPYGQLPYCMLRGKLSDSQAKQVLCPFVDGCANSVREMDHSMAEDWRTGIEAGPP